MMRFYDFQCGSCGYSAEVGLEVVEGKSAMDTTFPCECGGVASVVWKKAPGFAGKNKGIYPKYDVQLGMMIESTQHLNRVLKEKGLTPMGDLDFKRTLNNAHSPGEMKFDEAKFKDLAEKAWCDTVNGNIPKEEAISIGAFDDSPNVTIVGEEPV